MIHFVGAGPGATDLITLRGAELLRKADVVVYAGSLVNPDLLALVPKTCTIYDSSRMTLEEVLGTMKGAHENGCEVVRLHTGDPSIYGAIREQMDALDQQGIPFDDTPGVSSLCGAAASLRAEYTLPGVSQSLIVTRLAGRTPVPNSERLRDLASHGASMALFLSAGMLDEVQAELLQGGYKATTPVALVYKATWPDERIVRTSVGNLARLGKEAGIRSTALILVGDFLEGSYERSRLYDPSFSTGLREARPIMAPTNAETSSHAKEVPGGRCTQRAEPADACDSSSALPMTPPDGTLPLDCERPPQVRIVSFSDEGEHLATRLARTLDGVAWRCIPGGLARWTAESFAAANALVFVGAAGIAVRAISPHVRTKTTDPAVVVVDERGRFAIPILSGHLGGANDLARRIAQTLGAEAVVTTATDGRGVFAVDEWARHQGCVLANPGLIKSVSAKLLAGKTVRVSSDWPLPSDAPKGIAVVSSGHADVMLSARACVASHTLHVVPRILTLGIGCRRETPANTILQCVRDFISSTDCSMLALAQICSIDNKANEPGIVELSRKLRIPYRTFSAEQLSAVPGYFSASQFVWQTVGVDNVCERSAVLGSDHGTLMCPKTTRCGITLALACAEFSPTWRWSDDGS